MLVGKGSKRNIEINNDGRKEEKEGRRRGRCIGVKKEEKERMREWKKWKRFGWKEREVEKRNKRGKINRSKGRD